MAFKIIQNDITKVKVDAIVNAADTSLRVGGGVCGAIYDAAGAERLQDACDELAPIKTGEAVITEGFDLPSKYIIHTAGPVYRDGRHGEEALLRSCYTNSLELAVQRQCESVAFPLISSGIYGYPKAAALRVATDAITDFVGEHDIDVTLVVFDKAAVEVGEGLLDAVESYIDEHYFDEYCFNEHYVDERYVDEQSVSKRCLLDVDDKALKVKYTDSLRIPTRLSEYEPHQIVVAESQVIDEVESISPSLAGLDASLEDLVENLDEPFSATLLRLIDITGRKDAEIYRRANIDRRLFSKIRSDMNYRPSKPTVLAFAVALELTLDQTNDLLERAGFALTNSRKFDVIVEYFIANRKYDIYEINEVLFSYDQQLLGGTA